MEKQILRENRRLRVLEDYKILDTKNESDFDEITKLASEICHTPISLISFIDSNRQWFKSTHGLSIKETPRNVSFCTHTIQGDSLFVIENARDDERFKNSPLVVNDPSIVFYAGIPLTDAEGFSLGTLCVIDNKAKKLNEFQTNALKTLGRQVVRLLELRKLNYQLNLRNNILNTNYKNLEHFSRVISHDMKSPLNNILSLTDLLQQEYSKRYNDDNKIYIDYIKESSLKLKDYIDATLKTYKDGNASIKEKEFFTINSIVRNCNKLLNPTKEFDISLSNNIEIFNYKSYFEQILLNLISNAIKYNDKSKVVIIIDADIQDGYCHLSIKDNGMGIENDKIDEIFEMFTILDKVDRFNNVGTGIGLSTVKNLVERIDGEISVKSTLGVGTEFIIKFKP
ncbi:sensor histidine kinase [Flavobacterium sedimenticola]|uniref:histidine kinase n=1 Tax=Flavobacterium sedimenticola TaxID=3043286 RepID=A0ABT6XQE1_9FLAO|nr:GAF domain-containing sensor histidine kinase [Flavobacterium sedimenticola]MDI9257306.1 GAF domain-containing sensor histidine kinase [Flavobacterium sedimenticola]